MARISFRQVCQDLIHPFGGHTIGWHSNGWIVACRNHLVGCCKQPAQRAAQGPQLRIPNLLLPTKLCLKISFFFIFQLRVYELAIVFQEYFDKGVGVWYLAWLMVCAELYKNEHLYAILLSLGAIWVPFCAGISKSDIGPIVYCLLRFVYLFSISRLCYSQDDVSVIYDNANKFIPRDIHSWE